MCFIFMEISSAIKKIFTKKKKKVEEKDESGKK